MAKQIGRYTIVSELGRGGMGVVFKAWEESLQRHVAIKMLADQYAEDESVVARFMREARAVADVHHANIVQVFGVDTHDGQPYFVMEYVEGESLGDCIERESKLHPRKAVSLLKEAASGLAAAHARGVVHRDIKPANLMLSRHGNVKVVDFGIARVEGPETKLTATGMAMGTPAYLSPEVCLAKAVDQRSDIFSLGVVMYEMLTGSTPFNADSPLALMSKVVEARIPDLVELDGEIDASLYAILKVMLAAEPHNRYTDCHQLMADLDDYLAGQSPRHASQVVGQSSQVANDDDSATIAMSTPAEGQLPKATSARKQRNGGKGLVLAAVAGVLVLGGVSAASWWALSQSSLALPGFSQRSDEPIEVPEPVASVQPAANESQSDEALASMDDASSSGREPLADTAVPAGGSEQSAVADVDRADTPEDARNPPASGEQQDAEPPAETEQVAGMAWSSANQNAPDDTSPEPVASESSSSASVTATAASTMQDGAGADETPGEQMAQVGAGEGAAASLDQPAARSNPPASSTSQPQRESGQSQPVWDPADPRVAVVVVGDRLGAPAIQGRVEQQISDAGFRLFDADLVESPQRGGMAEFARALRAGGADVLVFVELEAAGQSQLSYYGRQDSLILANVEVRVVQLHDNKVMGPRWQRPMRYTQLNAEQKAYQMAGTIAQVVLRQLGRLP